MEDPIANVINTYHELNAAVVDELDEEPTALEFMRCKPADAAPPAALARVMDETTG